MTNIWQLAMQNTHRHSYSSPDALLISTLLVTGCVSGMGEGESEGNEEEGTQGVKLEERGGRGVKLQERGGGRGNKREADYLFGLLQRCLQPAYFLLILLPHLVHLLIMSGHFLLQGSFQSCQLPLSPPQHLLLLLLGQENFLHLQLQLHHVLQRRKTVGNFLSLQNLQNQTGVDLPSLTVTLKFALVYGYTDFSHCDHIY